MDALSLNGDIDASIDGISFLLSCTGEVTDDSLDSDQECASSIFALSAGNSALSSPRHDMEAFRRWEDEGDVDTKREERGPGSLPLPHSGGPRSAVPGAEREGNAARSSSSIDQHTRHPFLASMFSFAPLPPHWSTHASFAHLNHPPPCQHLAHDQERETERGREHHQSPLICTALFTPFTPPPPTRSPSPSSASSLSLSDHSLSPPPRASSSSSSVRSDMSHASTAVDSDADSVNASDLPPLPQNRDVNRTQPEPEAGALESRAPAPHRRCASSQAHVLGFA
eukprot:2371079-Rhodomonas_salina.1